MQHIVFNPEELLGNSHSSYHFSQEESEIVTQFVRTSQHKCDLPICVTAKNLHLNDFQLQKIVNKGIFYTLCVRLTLNVVYHG